MVALQATAASSTQGRKSNPSKKRKHEVFEREHAPNALDLWCNKKSSTTPPLSAFNIDLHLEDTPLPPEWQRCLDIKSGQVHYYNTRTRTRTSRDPRVSIDLELHLRCESPAAEEKDGDEEGKEKRPEVEMMAAVCMRCHMLVMFCKSLPACPNCKFVQPPG